MNFSGANSDQSRRFAVLSAAAALKKNLLTETSQQDDDVVPVPSDVSILRGMTTEPSDAVTPMGVMMDCTAFDATSVDRPLPSKGYRGCKQLAPQLLEISSNVHQLNVTKRCFSSLLSSRDGAATKRRVQRRVTPPAARVIEDRRVSARRATPSPTHPELANIPASPFHALIRESLPRYLACQTEEEKEKVIGNILESTLELGMLAFLRNGVFVSAPESTARRCIVRALEVERIVELQWIERPVIKVAANHDKGEEHVGPNAESAGSGLNADSSASEMQFHSLNSTECTFPTPGASNTTSGLRFSSFSMHLSLEAVRPYSAACLVTEREGSQFRCGELSSTLTMPPPSPRWKACNRNALDLLCEVASVDAASKDSM